MFISAVTADIIFTAAYSYIPSSAVDLTQYIFLLLEFSPCVWTRTFMRVRVFYCVRQKWKICKTDREKILQEYKYCMLDVAAVSKWCWFDSHVSDAILTSGINTIDPTSNQQISKLPLNYLIDQLEKPSSIWAKRGNGADILRVKQGGAVCHMSMLSLCKRSSIIRGLYCFCTPRPQPQPSINPSPPFR